MAAFDLSKDEVVEEPELNSDDYLYWDVYKRQSISLLNMEVK